MVVLRFRDSGAFEDHGLVFGLWTVLIKSCIPQMDDLVRSCRYKLGC